MWYRTTARYECSGLLVSNVRETEQAHVSCGTGLQLGMNVLDYWFQMLEKLNRLMFHVVQDYS